MKKEMINRLKKVWVNVCRFALAAVFIFSGFIKANDPQGTALKLKEYIQAFGLSDYLPDFFSLFGAVLLGVVEFTLGVYLLFGIRRKLTTIIVLIFLLFMTPLTLDLAIENRVADCGCFGDAVKLSNWETFWKNVLFLIAALSLFRWPALTIRIVSKKSQWFVSLYTILYISVISLYCLTYLPIFDFLPYRVGTNIREVGGIVRHTEDSGPQTVFVMEKDGVRKEFPDGTYPGDDWTLVEMRTTETEAEELDGHVFLLHSAVTGEDMTERVLTDKGYTFLLVAGSLDRAYDGSIDLINGIYDYCMENGYAFYCLTLSTYGVIEQWHEQTGAEYPYCIADETNLNALIHSNPGLVLIKDGVVINKWSCRNLPDEHDLSDRLEKLPLARIESQPLAARIAQVTAWFVLPLLLCTLLDKYLRERLNKRK